MILKGRYLFDSTISFIAANIITPPPHTHTILLRTHLSFYRRVKVFWTRTDYFKGWITNAILFCKIEKTKAFTVLVFKTLLPPLSNSNRFTRSENFLKIWDFPLVFSFCQWNCIYSSALKSPTQTTYLCLKNLKWVRGG